MEIEFKGLKEFLALVDRSSGKEFEQRLRKAVNDSATEWQTEAKQRVPVDTGLTRNTILKSVESSNQEISGAVGSNQKHAKFIEFGTKHIAGGAVEALGAGPEITDSQAVKSWPALFSRFGSRQQMPWLRPAFMAIKQKIVQRLQSALKF